MPGAELGRPSSSAWHVTLWVTAAPGPASGDPSEGPHRATSAVERFLGPTGHWPLGCGGLGHWGQVVLGGTEQWKDVDWLWTIWGQWAAVAQTLWRGVSVPHPHNGAKALVHLGGLLLGANAGSGYRCVQRVAQGGWVSGSALQPRGMAGGALESCPPGSFPLPGCRDLPPLSVNGKSASWKPGLGCPRCFV